MRELRDLYRQVCRVPENKQRAISSDEDRGGMAVTIISARYSERTVRAKPDLAAFWEYGVLLDIPAAACWLPLHCLLRRRQTLIASSWRLGLGVIARRMADSR